MARISLLQIRRGTTAEWTAADPTLAIGEMGYDTTLALLKIGDGSTKWSSLTPHQGSVGTPVSPSSLNNQIARHDGTSGLVIQNSLATIDDSGSITIPTGESYIGTTFDTNVTASGVTLTGTTLAADGTDAAIDINITPKGTGEVNLPKVDIDAGTIDGCTIATSDITVGSGKTLDISAGTLTHQSWAGYSPTLVWGTADPATITTVSRWTKLGKIVFFHIDISSADSNACSSLTISLPADPNDNNDRTAVSSIQKAGAGGATYSDPLAYIDMDSASKLIKFYAFTTGTDGQAVAVVVSGSYEAA
jgi:hypothetical protein